MNRSFANHLSHTQSRCGSDKTTQPEGKNIPVNFSCRGRRPSVKLKQQNCSHVRDKKETVGLTELQPVILDQFTDSATRQKPKAETDKTDAQSEYDSKGDTQSPIQFPTIDSIPSQGPREELQKTATHTDDGSKGDSVSRSPNTQQRNSITLTSLNTKNATTNINFLKSLSNHTGILLLQEHWLYNYQSGSLFDVFGGGYHIKCVDDDNPIPPSQHSRKVMLLLPYFGIPQWTRVLRKLETVGTE